VLTARRTYAIDSDLRFAIVERPAIGSVRNLQEYRDNAEPLRRESAERWLTQHRYSNEVTEDEVGADGIAGRGRLIFPIRCAGSLVWIRPSRRFVHRNARSIVFEASTFAPIG
jgi:hypothetical protein